MSEPGYSIHISDEEQNQIMRKVLLDFDTSTLNALKYQNQAFVLLFGFLIIEDLMDGFTKFTETLPEEVQQAFANAYYISDAFQKAIQQAKTKNKIKDDNE